jgi:hypothetical protein
LGNRDAAAADMTNALQLELGDRQMGRVADSAKDKALGFEGQSDNRRNAAGSGAGE